MAAVANPFVTEMEYLALAEISEEKLEFVDGEIRMMARFNTAWPVLSDP